MNCFCAIDRNQRAFLAQMTSFVARYDVIYHFFLITSQYLMTWGVESPRKCPQKILPKGSLFSVCGDPKRIDNLGMRKSLDPCSTNARPAREIRCSKMAVYEAFNGDVIGFATENATRKMDRHIALQVHHFSKSSRSFEKTLDKVLSLNISTFSELQVWRVKCSFDTRFGIYRPCILLRQTSSKHDNIEKYHVFLLESYDSLIMIGSFEVNRTRKSQIEFHLIDGPAVCWAVEDCVIFARYDPTLEKMTVETISVIDSINKPPVEEFSIFWCGLLRDETVAMGTKRHVTSDGENILTRWTCVSHTQKHIQEIPLVPNVYIPVVTFILIRDVSFGQSETMYDGLEVFLTTDRGQLLTFMDGHLKNCWSLPFNDACRIWILEVGMLSDSIIFYVFSQDSVLLF